MTWMTEWMTRVRSSLTPRARRRLRYAIALGIVLLSIGLSVGAFYWARAAEHDKTLALYQQAAGNRRAALQREIDADLELVTSIQALLQVSSRIGRSEFHTFSAPLLSQHHSLQALEWIPRVSDAARSPYEAAARQDGLSQFRITERNAQGQTIPAAERAEYYPVYYVEPDQGNQAALGYDLASDDVRRQALEAARDSGQRVATGRITLVQETGNQYGFLVFAPIYRVGAAPDSVPARRDDLVGFALGVFRIGDLVDQSLSYLNPEGIDIYLYDVSAPEPDRLLYPRLAATTPAPSSLSPTGGAEFQSTQMIDLAGRPWQMVFQPTPAFLAAGSTWQPGGVLAVGLAFAGIAGAFVFGNLNRTARVEQLVRQMTAEVGERQRTALALTRAQEELEHRVEERTAELSKLNRNLHQEIGERRRAEEALRQSESFYQSLVDVLPHRLCRKDLAGRFTFGNRSFCEAMNIPLADLKGKTDLDLHPPQLAEQYQRDDQYVLRTGEALTQTEEHKTLAGTASYVQVVKTPIRDPQGGVIGVQILFWDITEQKRMEDLLRRSHGEMEKHVQERTAELSALYNLARALAATDGLPEIFEAVLRYAVTTVHVTFARLLLLEGDRLVVSAMYPIRAPSASVPTGTSAPLAELSFCRCALLESHAEIIRRGDPDLAAGEEELLFQGGALTLCVVPLRAGEGPLGLLVLSEERGEEREPFTAEKRGLAESIGDQAAGAIRRAALHHQTRRRLDHAQSLRNVDMAITSSLDLNVTLNLLLAEAVSQLQVDAATILQLNPNTQMLHCLVARGVRSREIESTQLRLGQDFAGRVAAEQKMLRVSELHQKGHTLIQPFLRSIGDLDHYVGVPLVAKGQVKGVLEVLTRAPLEPDADWIALVESFALQAAIAMDNTDLFRNLQRSHADLSVAYEATIEGWSRALDLRDRETEGHSQRVTDLTMRLARQWGVKEDEWGQVRRGALLHDIGKMGIPDAILLKPGNLTPAERQIMQRHPTYAYELLYPIEYLRPALDIPYGHHEKWDGTGYPRRLKGDEIPLAARLFAVVDVWDALTSDRPYRQGWPRARVLQEIWAGSGSHFDPRVVQAFLEMMALDEAEGIASPLPADEAGA